MTISVKDLAKAYAEKREITQKEALERIEDVFDLVLEKSNGGEKVKTPLGYFEQVTRPARKGHNPQTGKEITIPESRSLKFKASASIKNSLN